MNRRRLWLNAIAGLSLIFFALTSLGHVAGGWRESAYQWGNWHFSTEGSTQRIFIRLWHRYPHIVPGPVRSPPESTSFHRPSVVWGRQMHPYISWGGPLLSVDWGHNFTRHNQPGFTTSDITGASGLIMVSNWFIQGVLLAISIIAFGWARRLPKYIDSSRALCANCGYDLRATPGRCPECGMIPTIAG